MRALPRLMVIAATALLVAGPATGQRADDELLPRSVELQAQARTQAAAGKFIEAQDLLETALAADPRNRSAYVDLARVAQRQKLFGKAIRLTNRALQLDPNDRDAIAVQGQAMVELGAVARAQANLQKLQQLCGSAGCAQVATLSAAISRGPTVAAAQVTPPKTN